MKNSETEGTAVGLGTPEHVVFTELDEAEGVLVDLNAKKYYKLNETAMLVWRALESGKGRVGALEELTAQFDVTRQHAAVSVERLVGELESRGLVNKNS